MTPLPPGFVLESAPQPAVPPLPPGFVLENVPQAGPVDDFGNPTETPLATPGDASSILPGPAGPVAQQPTALRDTAAAAAEAVASGANTATGLGAQVARGARTGIANVVGFPTDAGAALLNGVWNAGASIYDTVRTPTLSEQITGFQPTQRSPINDPFGGSASVDRGIGRVTDAVGAVGAAPVALIEALTGSPGPGMQQFARSASGALGGPSELEPPAPNGMAERAARRIGEEVGAAVPMAGAGLAAANAGVRGSNWLYRAFVEPYVRTPGAATASNVGWSVPAGAGAAAAGEAASAAGYGRDTPQGQLADVGGSLAGVGAGALASSLAARGADAVRLFRDGPSGYVDPVTRRAATETIADMFNMPPTADYDGLAQRIEVGNRPSDAIPGYRESLADRTGNPAVAAHTYGRSSGPRASVFAARTAENTEAIDSALQGAAPQGNSGALIEAAVAERNARLSGATAEADRLAAEADRIAATLYPQLSPQGRGQVIRSALAQALDTFAGPQRQAAQGAQQTADEALAALAPATTVEQRGGVIRGALGDAEAAASQNVRNVYAAADVAGTPVAPAPLAQALDGVTAGLTQAEQSLVPRDLIDRVAQLGRAEADGPQASSLLGPDGRPIMREAAPPAQVPIDEATSLRTLLMERSRQLRATGGENAARIVDQYTAAVENFIQSSLPPEQAAALGAARQAALARAEAFGRPGDPVREALRTREGGRPSVPDQNVPRLFVNENAVQPLDRLLAQADTPAVRTAVEEEILARANGNPAALLETYGQQLDRFPGLRERVTAAAQQTDTAQAAAAALAARETEFAGGSRLLTDATTVRPDGVPAVPDEVVARRAINPAGNRDLDALLTRADTPDVRDALRDEVLARSKAANADPDSVRNFVRDYAEPLRRFPGLGDELMAAADARTQAGAARDTLSEVERALRPGGSAIGTVASFGPDRAKDAMKAVIRSSDPAAAADEIVRAAGNTPGGVQGARRAFWDVLEESSRSRGDTTATTSGTQPWRAAALNRFLDDPATMAVAQRLYADNPEHLDRIVQIAKAMQGTSLALRGRAPSTSGTAQALTGGNIATPETAMSRLYQVEAGRISLPFAITSMVSVLYRRGMRAGRTEAINRMVDDALLNPDTAAALLRENNPANRAALRNLVTGRQVNRWSELVDMADDGDQQGER